LSAEHGREAEREKVGVSTKGSEKRKEEGLKGGQGGTAPLVGEKLEGGSIWANEKSLRAKNREDQSQVLE